MKLFNQEKAYPGKPENEKPILTSNGYSGRRACLYAAYCLLSLAFCVLMFPIWWDCVEHGLFDLIWCMITAAGVGGVLCTIGLTLREFTFFFRSRPTFVELYPDRLAGRSIDDRYFSVPLDKVSVQIHHSSDLTIYTDARIFTCFAGYRGKEIERFILDKKNLSESE